MIQLAVSGCRGRMGERIAHLALKDSAFTLSALLEHKDHPKAQGTIFDIPIQTQVEALQGSDLLIEFTSPQATLEHLDYCRENGIKMVIGTTGLSEEEVKRIERAAGSIPIVYSSNMSIGVNLLFKLTEKLAQTAPGSYSVSIIEAHHVHKKDAPSGTAKTLAQIIEKSSQHRTQDIKSIREGEIVGDHKIVFESPEDTLILDHHAKSRDIFAKGALVAAKFLANKEKGLYHMQDVLGLNSL